MADAAEITKSAEQTLSSSKNHNNNISNNNNNSSSNSNSYSNNKKKPKNKKKSASAASNNSHNHFSGVDVNIGIGIGKSISSTSPQKNGKAANVDGDGGIITSLDAAAAATVLTNGVVNVLLKQLHINGHTNGQEALEDLKNDTNCSKDRDHDSGDIVGKLVLNNATKSKAKSKHKQQQQQQQQKTEKHCHATTTETTITANNIREQVQKEKNVVEILSNGYDVDTDSAAVALALNQLLDLKSTDIATQSNDLRSSSASNTGTGTGAIPKVKPCKNTAKHQQTESMMMMANTTTRSSAEIKTALVNADPSRSPSLSSAPATNSEITISTLPSTLATEEIEANQFDQGVAITNNNQNNNNNNKHKHNKTCSSTTNDSNDKVKLDDDNDDDKVHNKKASTATEIIISITPTTTTNATTTTDIKATDIIASPPSLTDNDDDEVKIEYLEYEAEHQMHDIMRLIQAELSEPYSIYTYRYFIYNWPKLCFLARHGNEYVGAIVCKLDMHMNVRRGYIAMLAVRKEYRKLKIGTTLVQKAIEAMLMDNADEVVLETEMRNVPALRLYENLGFVRDKRLFRYYLNGVDALRLKLWFR